jgi:hypothetical protein
MTPEQIAAASRLLQPDHDALTPPTDPYEFETYKILMQRGKPQAEAIEKAKFWGAMKRADQAEGKATYGPADSPVAEIDAKYHGSPRIEVNPITGRREFKGSFHPEAALNPQSAITGNSSIGTPPSILEYTRNSWIGMRTPVDRFSLNPGQDYYIEIPGPAPTMFAGGRDLPVITGSGVDPSVLRWVAWPVRTTAAFAESRGRVAQLIEMSLEGDPEEFHDVISVDGRLALENYWGRIAMWVSTPIEPNAPLTEDDYSSFFPGENGGP